MSGPVERKPLRQYVVLFRLEVRHESDGHAYSPEEAVRLAIEQVKFCPPAFNRTAWVPEAVEEVDPACNLGAPGWEVVGRCEACEAWILDGPGQSGHSSSEESGYLCGGCTREAMAEQEAWDRWHEAEKVEAAWRAEGSSCDADPGMGHHVGNPCGGCGREIAL